MKAGDLHSLPFSLPPLDHHPPTQSAFASANNGNGDNRVFSPSVEEFDKDDRRGCCGRIRAFLKSRKTQHQQRFNDSRYYEDTFNPFPWTCSFGTDENDGIWLNRKDQGGILMAVTVWLLIGTSGLGNNSCCATRCHLIRSRSMSMKSIQG